MGGESPGAPRNEGGTNSKKRRGTTINLSDFPDWLSTKSNSVNQEIYVHIRAVDGDVAIARRNRFLVAKILKEKTSNITKASYNMQGDLILRIKGEKEAEKVLGMKAIGEWKVNVERHKTLNTSKGVVYSRDMSWMAENEILDGLSEYKVTEAFFFKRKPRESESNSNTEARPFGLGVLTFNTLEPPKRIRFGFEYLDIKPYVPNPKRCKKCQKLGHTTKWCKNVEEVCAECGQDRGQNHVCGIKMCVNCCKPGHASSSRDCPRFLMEKEVEFIKIDQKMTNFEAKKFFFKKYNSLEGYLATLNKNMAQIVGSQTAQQIKPSSSGKEPETNKATTKNIQPEKEENTKKTSHKESSEAPVQAGDNNKTQEEPAQQSNRTSTQGETSIKESSTVSNSLGSSISKNSYIKLKSWKHTTKGIIYILDSRTKGEGVPKVDFTRFKGKRTPKNEKIEAHARNILGRSEVITSIMEETAKKDACSKVMVRVEKGVAKVEALAEEEESEETSSGEENNMDTD